MVFCLQMNERRSRNHRLCRILVNLGLGVHAIMNDDVVGEYFIQHEDSSFDSSASGVLILAGMHWRHSWTEAAGAFRFCPVLLEQLVDL